MKKKGGYKLIPHALSATSEGSGSGLAHLSGFSEGWIWKIDVLNKIRHFLWHVASDLLPTKINLARRVITIFTGTCVDLRMKTLFMFFLVVLLLMEPSELAGSIPHHIDLQIGLVAVLLQFF